MESLLIVIKGIFEDFIRFVNRIKDPSRISKGFRSLGVILVLYRMTLSKLYIFCNGIKEEFLDIWDKIIFDGVCFDNLEFLILNVKYF